MTDFLIEKYPAMGSSQLLNVFVSLNDYDYEKKFTLSIVKMMLYH